jgi:hypothetical protein
LRRLHGKGDVPARAEMPGGRLMQDRLVRAEPDHREASRCRVRGQDPDIRAAVLAEAGGDAEVDGAVVGRCGQRPARRDQRRIQLGHAVAGTPVQLGPHQVPAEIPDDPPLVMMGAVRPGAVRTRLGSDHRDRGTRRQVPGNRRAEHPVTDDQEVHDGIIPGPRIGATGCFALIQGQGVAS